MKTSIYVSYHEKTDRLEDPIFRYIYCGAAVNGEENYLPGTLRDDMGENISELNPWFCECTALYWIWKNDRDSDRVGLMHYRRHLNFSEKRHANIYGMLLEEERLTAEYARKYGLDSSHVRRLAEAHEIIMPERYDDCKYENNYRQYANSPYHHIEDLEAFEALLLESRPEFAEATQEFNKAKSAYYANMFVLERKLFDDYCSILFDVLFRLHAGIDYYNRNARESRAPSFAAERFLDIYMRHIRKKGKKALELQGTWIRRPHAMRRVEFSECVPIIMSANDSFLKYVSAAILSMMEVANSGKDYRIFILHSGISQENMESLEAMVKEAPNFRVEFIDCSWLFGEIKLPEHMHFTRETYYRFAIPQIFQDFEKVIYLDGDIIVKRDIADLLATDMQGNAIAGVRDYMFEGMCFWKFPCLPEIYQGSADDYAKNYLKIDPADYIQAGVLIFDISRMRAKKLDKKFFEQFYRSYWFVDQDILNIALEGEKHFLDIRWNVHNGNGNLDTFYKDLPTRLSNKYYKALEAPWIIHYAGGRKPWLEPDIKYAWEFWKNARKSPFYESMLLELPRGNAKASHSPAIRDRIFPRGSKRREYAKRLYFTAKKLVRFH